jgi:hypothetical protein
MKLFVKQLSPLSPHFIPLRAKYPPQYTVLETFSLCRAKGNNNLRIVEKRVSVKPETVSALSQASNAFFLSNTGIVSSNPARGMDVCFYSLPASPVNVDV